MIILSGVLVVVAIALLVAGIVAGNGDSAEVFNLDALFVIYISIAVSIVSALCLAVGVFLRRKELFGPGVSAAPTRKSKAKARAGKTSKDRRAKTAPAPVAKGAPQGKAPAGEDAPDVEADVPAPVADVPEDALVFVVRGRKRYHLDTCRQLAGRETEELTYAEAKEEGFSPCTACMPDTALAARAAVPAPASTDAGEAAGAGSAPAKPGVERPEGGLAGLAKPAPSPATAPTSFDKTTEIPRAGETGGRDAEGEPRKAAGRPAPSPAGPTLTDMPVASLLTPAQPAAAQEPAEQAGSPEHEADDRADDRADDAARPAAADVAADPGGEDPPEATAPKPRDADDDEDAPASAPAGEPGPDRADDAPADEARADEARATEPGAEAPAAEAPADEPDGDAPQVRILSGTKRYHRTDCALIEDIGDEADDLESLSRAEAKSRGCTPCLVCQPDREHARD